MKYIAILLMCSSCFIHWIHDKIPSTIIIVAQTAKYELQLFEWKYESVLGWWKESPQPFIRLEKSNF